MKKIYLYFHNDLDGIISCVLAFHIFRAMNFSPIIAKSVIPEELAEKKRKFKAPFAILDSVYRPDAFAYFDHHSMNKPKKISKKTKIYAFNGKANSCAKVIYDYAKKRNIKLPDDGALKKLVYWANIIDRALYADYGVKAIETIKPKLPVMKINIALEKTKRSALKKIIKMLIKKPSLEYVAKQDFIRKKFKETQPLKEKSLKKFKKNSYYDKKIGVVIYDSTSFYWNRFAHSAAYPQCSLAVGIVKTKNQYKIKISRNPWNKKINKKIKKLDVSSLVKKFGGGGHKFVASARFSSYKDAKNAMQSIILEIRSALLD